MKALRLAVCALLVVSVTSCGGTTTPTTATTTPTTVSASIPTGARLLGSAAFVPNPITVAVGTKITWTNNDTSTHDVVSDTAGVFDSGAMTTGVAFSSTFNTKGTFTYHCSLHPLMVGTVTVQ